MCRAEKSDKERSKSSSFPFCGLVAWRQSGPLELPRKNSRYLLNESNLYGDRPGPHRLDNDIDLTMTLSNHRGTAMWAAWKEGSLELEVGFDKLNLSDRAEAA